MKMIHHNYAVTLLHNYKQNLIYCGDGQTPTLPPFNAGFSKKSASINKNYTMYYIKNSLNNILLI